MKAAIVDFQKFLGENALDQKAVAAEIVDSLRRTGFVSLINTSIPVETIQEAEAWNRRFFRQTPQQRHKVVNVPSPNPQRGWSYKGAESTARLKNPSNLQLTDEKEHFDVGSPDDIDFPNKWMESELPGFQQFSESFYHVCQELCLHIMRAFELTFNLPVGMLKERCQPAASELRYNFYPPVSLGKLYEGQTRRGWPHTDFGLITLLFQDTQGGLQYEDRANPGNFLALQRQTPDEIAVNISDTFQRWTNDHILAGVHQVWLPPLTPDRLTQKDYVLPPRISNVFFFKPRRDAMVGALPQFVAEGQTSRYDNITALDFHKRMTDVLVRNALNVSTCTAGSL